MLQRNWASFPERGENLPWTWEGASSGSTDHQLPRSTASLTTNCCEAGGNSFSLVAGSSVDPRSIPRKNQGGPCTPHPQPCMCTCENEERIGIIYKSETCLEKFFCALGSWISLSELGKHPTLGATRAFVTPILWHEYHYKEPPGTPCPALCYASGSRGNRKEHWKTPVVILK